MRMVCSGGSFTLGPLVFCGPKRHKRHLLALCRWPIRVLDNSDPCQASWGSENLTWTFPSRGIRTCSNLSIRYRHTGFVVEPAYRYCCNDVDGTDDGRFPLPWEYEPWIANHELCSSGFRHVL